MAVELESGRFMDFPANPGSQRIVNLTDGRIVDADFIRVSKNGREGNFHGFPIYSGHVEPIENFATFIKPIK